ncbi:MAG TPA: lysophospholipid acyltransferase family protein [Anaerolineales bacterium]|jgi:1-acyl-sn-glycerol-3-phosphate acyltransferase
MLKIIVGGLFRILGRIRLSGFENIPRGGAYIAALNHVSIIDPPFTLCFWPETLEAVGAEVVFDRPLQGELLKLYGVIPVHRGNYDRVLIDAILSLLRAGRPMMIAPEGRRSHVRAMQRARPGVGFILEKAAVPVLPVALIGTTGDFLQRGLRGERPMIEMRVGRPIHLPPVPQDPVERRAYRQKTADLVMSHIAGLLPEDYRGVYADSVILPSEAGH